MSVGHGSSVARTILAAAPSASIVNAQVFHDAIAAPPAAIAAALGWVVERGARVVNLSFGVRQDREVLRLACAAARAAGAILLAAAPARGSRVFPASYPGVIRVSGDARCAPDEVSRLASAQADFGACPATIDGACGARAPRPRGSPARSRLFSRSGRTQTPPASRAFSNRSPATAGRNGEEGILRGGRFLAGPVTMESRDVIEETESHGRLRGSRRPASAPEGLGSRFLVDSLAGPPDPRSS